MTRLVRLVLCLVFAAASLSGWPSPVWAQTPPGALPVQSINAVPEAGAPVGPVSTPFAPNCDDLVSLPGCDGRSTELTYLGTNRRLVNFDAGDNTYQRLSLPGEAVTFQRNTVAGLENRQVLFFESAGNIPLPIVDGVAIDLSSTPSPQTENLESVLLSPFINRGIDNVFTNVLVNVDDQDTRNNIQRVDYTVPVNLIDNIQNPDTEGFVVFERGGNDNFRIAAVTAVDVNGLPTDYGPLLQAGGDAASGAWGNTNQVEYASVVSRRELNLLGTPTEDYRLSHTVGNQPIRGIFFPISSLVPANTPAVFGYSLFAQAVDPVADPTIILTNVNTFPTDTTNANGSGGLDLVAGGFGLFRITQPQPEQPNFSLLKRITNLFGVAPLPDFTQVVGDGTALALLQANGLGQGLDVITDPQVQPGNGIEYTVYFANSGPGAANNVVLCDQIPMGLTFDPDGYGPGLGIQVIAASNPPGPVVDYTNAADGDPGTFLAPGEALPPFCGTDQGNGAVVLNVADVAADQVGFIRFRTIVD